MEKLLPGAVAIGALLALAGCSNGYRIDSGYRSATDNLSADPNSPAPGGPGGRDRINERGNGGGGGM